MAMKKTLALVFSLLLLLTGSVWGQDKVRAVGTAAVHGEKTDVARDKALDNALRNAVEEKAGVMVTGVTEVQDFQVKMDQILSESRGFVKNYRVLEEGRRGREYRVVIEAEVETGRLRDRMEALQLLMVRKEKPRLLLLFQGKGKAEATAEAVLTRVLMAEGFKLVDYTPQGGEGISAAVFRADRKAVASLARTSGAEVIILLALEDTPRSFKMGEIEVKSHEISLAHKIVNGDTGEVIASGVRTQKGDFKETVEAVSTRVGREIRDAVIQQWTSEVTNVVTIRLHVEGLKGYRDVDELNEALREGIKGLKQIYQRSYSRGEVEMDLEVRGTTRGVAEDLSVIRAGGRSLHVVEMTASRIAAVLRD